MHFMAGGLTLCIVKFVVLGLVLAGIAIYWGSVTSPPDLEDMGAVAISLSLILGFLELAVLSSRVFGAERKWGTLGSIALLPLSIRQIAWHKAIGCLFGVAPWAAWFALGAAACPEPVMDVLEEAVSEPGGWYFMISVVLFFHLAALFSILMRRGGLIVALIAWWIGSWVILPVFYVLGIATEEVGMLIACLVLVALTALVHVGTLRRLARVAGE
jgi:hypothetical protein